MKRLEKISVLTAKLKKAVAEEGIGGLAGRTKGYLARAKKEKEFQREKSRVYRDILFISGCNEQLPHPHRYRVVHQMEQLEAAGIPAGLVRMSCGLEDKEDLIADLAQALDAI